MSAIAHAPAIWSKWRSFMEQRRILLCGYGVFNPKYIDFGVMGSAVPLVRRSFAKERLTLRAVGNTLRVMTTVQSPINLKNWIEENREKFKPPVSNRYLYDGRDFFVMVIKGPNARNDF